jgi:hypothetical protein
VKNFGVKGFQPPSRAEVKERVELYLYSPSGPSWPVLGWNLPAHSTKPGTPKTPPSPLASFNRATLLPPPPPTHTCFDGADKENFIFYWVTLVAIFRVSYSKNPRNNPVITKNCVTTPPPPRLYKLISANTPLLNTIKLFKVFYNIFIIVCSLK